MKTNDELIEVLRAACNEAGTQEKWALENDIQPPAVSDMLTGKRPITPAVAGALGYGPVRMWKKFGE